MFDLYIYTLNCKSGIEVYLLLPVIIETVHVSNEIKTKWYCSVLNHCGSKLKDKFTNKSSGLCIVEGFYSMCGSTFARKQTSLSKNHHPPFGKKKTTRVYGPAFRKKVLLRTSCCQFSWHSPRVACEANRSKVGWRQWG